MGRKSIINDTALKQRLTLAELAEHDDVCSDVMVDNAYFKSRIRKYRPKHIPVRGVKEDDVPQILLHKVIVAKDVVAAEKELLKLPGLIRYRKSLRSKTKDEHFLDHIRKYIYMYQTDCQWEVSTTNRYTITNYEAAVTARKRIKQGETIKYLTGTLVPLSTEESMDLDLTNRNFSIVVNARKKSDQMFLGPARFANHDCSPNGRLIMKGVDSMEVKADKNINIGDEITVSYGENYFGPDNVECLCHTCEVLERNGWTSKAAFTEIQCGTPPVPLPDLLPESSSPGQKRKRESSSSSLSQPARTLKRLKSLASPSKLQYSWTPPSTSESEVAQEDAEDIIITEKAATPPTRIIARSVGSLTPKRDVKGRFISSASKSNPESNRDKSTGRMLPKKRKSFPLSPSTTSPSSQDFGNEAPQERFEHPEQGLVPVTIKIEAVEKTTLESDEPVVLKQDEDDTIVVDTHTVLEIRDLPQTPEPSDESVEPSEDQPGLLPGHNNLETGAPPESLGAPQATTTLTMTKISTIASIEPMPEITFATTTAEVIPSIEPLPVTTQSITKAKVTVTPLSDSIRVPGDYILTRKLLAQPHDRWVRCHNDICHTFFLQPNGYQTRRECPRCERHSMLYGFPWPKTDPDPRKLLSRKDEGKSSRGKPKKSEDAVTLAPPTLDPEPPRKRLKSEISPTSKYSAYRRQGRCGKGTWVEGGGDEEERVMDHRTIHRFVLPDEERELTRKGLLIEAEQARAMGEDELAVLANLDGRRARFRDEGRGSESRESSGFLAGTETEREESLRLDVMREWGEDVDGEGRRRSNRIVESRVYVNVNMRR